MTVDEFITKLSPKAQNILDGNLLKSGKIAHLFIDSNFHDSRYGVASDENYFIKIKDTNNISQMEYSILHEFCHIMQEENNIPFIKAKQEKYSDLTVCVNSMILDIDVASQLIEWGFPFEVYDFDCHIVNLKNVIEAISRNDVNFSSNYSKILIYLEVVGHINIYKIFMNNDKTKSLIELCKTKNRILFEMLNYIEIITHNKDLKNPKDVHRIFRYIIKKYSLHEYLELSPFQLNQ